MRISSAIKEKLHQNAARTQAIRQHQQLTRVQQIELEYLQMEAQTFQEMLTKLKKSWWRRLLPRKNVFYLAIVLGMSTYVVSMFNVFDQMDLNKVEQWEFAVTAVPFWLMIALVPMAIITLLTSNDH
ncbi:MAG: hypothetical protein OER04_01475 [Cyclobacteriaceae bacterium]|nr:hypothetical protein [Cyclobacteriaceae bacterium]